MPDDLKKTQLRAIQYFFVDGTFEFGFGLMCLILALFFYAETHVEGWLLAIVDSSLVLVMISGVWLINRLVTKLKERLTWPRTGYVSYMHKNGIKRGWRIALGLIVGGVVAAGISDLNLNQNIRFAIMPLFSGVLFGLVMFILGWRTATARFQLLGLLSALIGVALAFSGLGNYPGLVGYYASCAVILPLTGLCVLRTYLRQNPLPGKEEQDER